MAYAVVTYSVNAGKIHNINVFLSMQDAEDFLLATKTWDDIVGAEIIEVNVWEENSLWVEGMPRRDN